MTSSLLHLVCLRPRVDYTLTNFRGGGGGRKVPLHPLQYANIYKIANAIFVHKNLKIRQKFYNNNLPIYMYLIARHLTGPQSSQHAPNNQETPRNIVLRQVIGKITIVKL